MSAPSRKGVTLIDVSVVLCILLAATAVVVPMVLQARAGARVSSCKCRLKQLGVALHNYEETHKTFPPGWVAVRGPDSGDEELSAYGWGTYVLPFMDHNALYKTIQFDAADPSFQYQAQRQPTPYAAESWSSLRCETAAGVQLLDGSSSVAEIGTATYVGNFGVGIPRLHQDSHLLRGILGCNSRVRIRDIRDGVTNVILLGERILPGNGKVWPLDELDGAFNSYWPGIPRGTNPLAIVGTVTDGELSDAEIVETGIFGMADLANRPQQLSPKLRVVNINQTAAGRSLTTHASFGRETSAGFSSYHAGGAQFLMGDASVRFLNDTTDRHVYVSLMHRNNGMPHISK